MLLADMNVKILTIILIMGMQHLVVLNMMIHAIILIVGMHHVVNVMIHALIHIMRSKCASMLIRVTNTIVRCVFASRMVGMGHVVIITMHVPVVIVVVHIIVCRSMPVVVMLIFEKKRKHSRRNSSKRVRQLSNWQLKTILLEPWIAKISPDLSPIIDMGIW